MATTSEEHGLWRQAAVAPELSLCAGAEAIEQPTATGPPARTTALPEVRFEHSGGDKRRTWLTLAMGVAAAAVYIGVDMVQRWIAVGTLLGLFGAPTTSYAATSGEETVSGSWLNAVPCVLTNYSNETGRFTCTGSSVWLGAWEGVTAFEFKAVMDRSTGNVHGTITETFAGSSTAEHAVGTLSFTEVLDFDGRTGAVQIEADITGGAGDPPFRCSSGHVSYDGWAAPVAMGFGGWRGTWKHGCP